MKRWLIPVLGFALLSILLNQVFERVLHFSFVDAFKTEIAHPGIPAALVIVGALGLDFLLPIPSSLVMVLSGVLFGTFWGGVLSLIGSLGGNWFAFELMRRYGLQVCQRFVDESQVRRMQPVIEKFGAVAIILSRPVPVMMETLSFLAGLMRMRRDRFLLASLAGTLPISFLYARAGAASWDINSLLPALFVILCVPAIGWFIAQRKFNAR